MNQQRSTSIRALMWETRRSSERLPVERVSTLRSGNAPSDVMIDNMSLTGFRMSGVHGLHEGDLIRVGLAGVGVRDATVIWLGEAIAGCSFAIPITPAEFECTISANTVIEAKFSADPAVPEQVKEKGGNDEVKSGKQGLRAFFSAIILSWAAVVALGYAIFAFIA